MTTMEEGTPTHTGMEGMTQHPLPRDNHHGEGTIRTMRTMTVTTTAPPTAASNCSWGGNGQQRRWGAGAGQRRGNSEDNDINKDNGRRITTPVGAWFFLFRFSVLINIVAPPPSHGVGFFVFIIVYLPRKGG
jgi:hypothetical protein